MTSVIKTAPALSSAITTTYLADIALAIVCVAIMLLIIHLINWQSGKNDKSGQKRRIWFFVMCFVSFVGAILLNWFMFKVRITVPAFVTKYMTHLFLGAFVSAAVYFIVGFLLVKLSRVGTKLESVFPKKA